MAQAVIKPVEAVNIDEKHDEAVIRMAAGAYQGVLQAVNEQGPVGGVGQAIVKRAGLEHLLGALALSDIAIDDDQSFQLAVAILNGAGSGFQDAPIAILVTHAIF